MNPSWIQILRGRPGNLGMAYLVLLLALCMTIGAWYFSRLSHASSQAVLLSKLTDGIQQTLQRHIDSYTHVLSGVAGLHQASVSVERDEFRAYLVSTHIIDRLPGIRGIGFARLVRNQDMDAFITQVRNDTSLRPDGYPQFNVHGLNGDDAHLIVDFIEPFDSNNAVFGMDMGFEPQRHATIQRARDTGLAAATPPLSLWVNTSQDFRGVLIMQPIYRNGQATDTPAARRAAFKGVVFARLAGASLFGVLVNERAKESAHILVEDIRDTGHALQIHSSDIIGALTPTTLSRPGHWKSPIASGDSPCGLMSGHSSPVRPMHRPMSQASAW